MMKLAMENNLSETAFIVKEDTGYHLRWFTPGTEVELCGHATLASSFVILNYYEKESNEVCFNTLSGELIIKKKDNRYEMNFPTYGLKEIAVTDDMEKAYGVRPVKAVLGLDLVCVFETEEQVRNIVLNCPLRRILYVVLQLIATTDMQKVYKMPILYGFYNEGDVRLAVTDAEVVESWKNYLTEERIGRIFRK